MAATPKEKFDAAVRVIQSLPKNGTFQPSHELMLRFYGFYKQATLGPCKPPRPGFWDVVGKAKWDAWNALGKMPRSEAMVQYVDELKKHIACLYHCYRYERGLIASALYHRFQTLDENDKKIKKVPQIIEMMPQTPTVAGFIEKLGAFYELVDDSDIQRLPKINGDVANNNNPTIDMSCIVEKHLSKNPDENDHTTFQRNHNSCDVNDLNHTDFADLEAESISCSKISDSDDLLSEDEDFIFNNGDDVDTRLHGNTSILSDNVNNNEIVSVKTNAISYHQETVQIIQLPVSSSTPLKVKKSNMNDNCTEEDVIDNTAVKTNGYPVSSDTDSDADEFCDTSDQVSPLISAKPKLSPKLIHSNHRKYETTAQIHRNDGTAMPPLVTSIPNNSETQTNAVTNRGGGDQRPTHSRPSATGSTGFAAGSDQDLVSVGDSPQSSQALPLTTGSGGDGGRPPTQYTSVQVNVNEQITAALAQLQLDMNHVLTRLNTLETYALLQRQILAEEVERERLRTNNQPSWWPFNQLSSRTVVFIVVWPFVAQWIMKILFKRRKPMR